MHNHAVPSQETTMKFIAVALVASLAAPAMAFAPVSSGAASRTALKADPMPDRLWNDMVDPTKRSASVPFLPLAKNLDGSMVGDYGFDPFYLSSIPKNFAGFIQPPSWEETKGLPTLYWMREAELKHGRVAMLAVPGWIATDLGARFPFAQFSKEAIPTGYNAHDILVEQGTMTVLLMIIGFIEFCSAATLVEVSKGESDREAGDFGLDPPGLLLGKSKEYVDRMKLKEINNGRIAMLAFGGIATQTALGATEFPYF
jgi:Chlorophyll A-B binding protein